MNINQFIAPVRCISHSYLWNNTKTAHGTTYTVSLILIETMVNSDISTQV